MNPFTFRLRLGKPLAFWNRPIHHRIEVFVFDPVFDFLAFDPVFDSQVNDPTDAGGSDRWP